MTPIDWQHTQKAKHDRTIKAAALAAAARRLHLRADDLVVGSGNRRRVRVEAGIQTASEDTWHAAHQLLTADPTPAPVTRPAPVCGLGAPYPASSHHGEVHLYPGGPLCDAHSPWAMAGKPRPVPPPIPPEIARRRALTPATGPRHTLVDDRAIASGKRRASTTTRAAARAAEAQRKATERARRNR